LREAGRSELADSVRWVSDKDGDGYGHDVQSFDPVTGEKIYIEVKATNGTADTAFFFTSRELEFGASNSRHFRIYRVFQLATAPKLFVLEGDPRRTLQLAPTQFRALPKKRRDIK